RIRPLLNWQVVMDPREAAQLCSVLRPRYAIPMHYAFTGGAFHNTFVVKRNGTPEEFVQAAAERAPATNVRILAPGEPLRIEVAVGERFQEGASLINETRQV
ncbi:MAG: hypothetical protein ACRDHP_11295, partial [Ktedonobacterales bacterium]